MLQRAVKIPLNHNIAYENTYSKWGIILQSFFYGGAKQEINNINSDGYFDSAKAVLDGSLQHFDQEKIDKSINKSFCK